MKLEDAPSSEIDALSMPNVAQAALPMMGDFSCRLLHRQ